MAMPIMPAQRTSIHKIYAAIIVIIGAAHNGFTSTDIISNRSTSFDNKLTNFPGAVSVKALCDN